MAITVQLGREHVLSRWVTTPRVLLKGRHKNGGEISIEIEERWMEDKTCEVLWLVGLHTKANSRELIMEHRLLADSIASQIPLLAVVGMHLGFTEDESKAAARKLGRLFLVEGTRSLQALDSNTENMSASDIEMVKLNVPSTSISGVVVCKTTNAIENISRLEASLGFSW